MAHPMAVPGFGVAHSNGFHGVQLLTSWKDIANYMGKGVRTVQRWEQEFGLPVRRPTGSNKKAVLARPHDLDAWVALRCRSRAVGNDDSTLRPDECFVLTAALVAELTTARSLREINRTVREEIERELISMRQTLAALTRSIGQQGPTSPAREN